MSANDIEGIIFISSLSLMMVMVVAGVLWMAFKAIDNNDKE